MTKLIEDGGYSADIDPREHAENISREVERALAKARRLRRKKPR